MRRGALSVPPMILKLEAQFLEHHTVSRMQYQDALSTPQWLTEIESRLLERATPAPRSIKFDALNAPTWLRNLEERCPECEN
uniref:Uncharacterized protein n=1 Tax=Solanum lycopersicum TaxID=4081 RepID=A0A3Q7EVW3_SOLLC